MNTVGTVDCSGGAYMYTRLHTYMMLYYTYTVYMYYVSIKL
jgi:hypothetical protein